MNEGDETDGDSWTWSRRTDSWSVHLEITKHSASMNLPETKSDSFLSWMHFSSMIRLISLVFVSGFGQQTDSSASLNDNTNNVPMSYEYWWTLSPMILLQATSRTSHTKPVVSYLHPQHWVRQTIDLDCYGSNPGDRWLYACIATSSIPPNSHSLPISSTWVISAVTTIIKIDGDLILSAW